ncbi:NifB/NifX family molybdenum-iron cluster-binding protein [Vibrio cholerae]
MILAVPSRHGVPFNHFAKAPSFSVIDSNTQQLQAEFHLELDPSKSCGKKSAILHQLRHYQIEGVAVRQIGQSMLQALFNAGIRVYALPRGVALTDLVLTQLQPITDLSYGKASPNKVHGERGCGKHSSNPSGSRNTFVSPSTHLFQRGFSIKRLWKEEER